MTSGVSPRTPNVGTPFPMGVRLLEVPEENPGLLANEATKNLV